MTQPKSQVQMMEEARKQASFDSRKLAEIIYGRQGTHTTHEIFPSNTDLLIAKKS
jgi:hypothetical protein